MTPPAAAYAGFAGFGAFWGAWGAALPALRQQAGVSEGQLGAALLFVGVGALPAMAATGRLVDRRGSRLTSLLLAALAAAGALVAVGARSAPALVVGALLVGAASGAADVAINTLAGRAEHATGRPLLTRAHGVFSLAVVVASLSTGALLGADWSLTAVFALVAGALLALGVVAGSGDGAGSPRDGQRPPAPAAVPLARRLTTAAPLLLVGAVAALAFAVENAHQSWGAVLLTDAFAASPQLAAAAPAVFAGTTALARLALAPLSRSRPTAVLLCGGALATAGSAVVATAPTAALALLGFVVAALGTATLFPTLLSRTLRTTDPARHGAVTSTVASTAYLGFLLGPAYVGLLAEASDLRGALLGVAALALVFTATAAPVSRWASRRGRPAA